MKFTKSYVLSLPKTVNDIGCWLYTGYLLRGYGTIGIDYEEYYINRIVLEAYYDVAYDNRDIEACHKPTCPNKHCFNPEHLYPGTHYQNMQDKKISKTHQNTKKKVCPKCGGQYTTYRIRIGDKKGKTWRRCNECYKKKRKARVAI